MNKQEYNKFIMLWAFYNKEVSRFLKVWGQTILGPVITTSLFLMIFIVAVGEKNTGLPYTYAQFLVPGLIMMTVIQNAFSNTSSSLMMAKMHGNIIDVFMSPLTGIYVVTGFLLGAITRGLFVSIAILLYSMIFIDVKIYNIGLALYYVISASGVLGLMGVIAGIICIKFDQISNFTSLFITPFSFLSGTFYSISKLPESVQTVIHYNPFFYMIDGLRYSFLGTSDSHVLLGGLVLLAINIVLFTLCVILWNKGYRIKS